MRLLLRHPRALWWLDDDPNLGPAAREAILAARQVAVSIWEIAVKLSSGKLRLDLDEALRQAALDGFERLTAAMGPCRSTGHFQTETLPSARDRFPSAAVRV